MEPWRSLGVLISVLALTDGLGHSLNIHGDVDRLRDLWENTIDNRSLGGITFFACAIDLITSWFVINLIASNHQPYLAREISFWLDCAVETDHADSRPASCGVVSRTLTCRSRRLSHICCR
ncbi:hypothetical protein V1520DRAFT_348783 [Lipomyces starkeyi]